MRLGTPSAPPDSRATVDLSEPGRVLIQKSTPVWSIEPGAGTEWRGRTSIERVFVRTANSLLVVDAKRRSFLEFPETQ